GASLHHSFFFFFSHRATTQLYTLSLHDALPISAVDFDATGEVTELLQHLIRNSCVNDGGAESGHEVRNADLLRSYLDGPGRSARSEEHTSELQSRFDLVCRLLLEKKNTNIHNFK